MASLADTLLTDLRRGDPDALRRLRAYVPRHAAAATDAATAELGDARLIIARELGFPTWRELVSLTEKSRRDLAERQQTWRRLRPQAEALLAGDTGRLAQLTAGQADTLLQMLAYPKAIPGTRLREELTVRGYVGVTDHTGIPRTKRHTPVHQARADHPGLGMRGSVPITHEVDGRLRWWAL